MRSVIEDQPTQSFDQSFDQAPELNSQDRSSISVSQKHKQIKFHPSSERSSTMNEQVGSEQTRQMNRSSSNVSNENSTITQTILSDKGSIRFSSSTSSKLSSTSQRFNRIVQFASSTKNKLLKLFGSQTEDTTTHRQDQNNPVLASSQNTQMSVEHATPACHSANKTN